MSRREDEPPPLADEAAHDKMLAELTPLKAAVEKRLKVMSRWTGNLQVVEAVRKDANGLFTADGDIVLPPVLARRKDRWRVYLHELVHSIASPVPLGALDRNRGWEEGPVELLQRLVRANILKGLNVSYDETHIRKLEVYWRYNPYIEAIEAIIAAVNPPDPVALLVELLQTPLPDRAALLIQRESTRGNRQAMMEIGKQSATLKRFFAPTPASDLEKALLEQEDEVK